MNIPGTPEGTAARPSQIWHKNFWKLNAVVLLMSVAVYMQLPVFMEWMSESPNLGADNSPLVAGTYCIGLFSLGTVCSYLIQRYRRNKVCMLSMLIVAACISCATYLRDNMADEPMVRRWAVGIAATLRFLIGAFFGLTTMILNSTLIVDNCDSPHRDHANVISAWLQRLAILLGPIAAMLLKDATGFSNAMYLSALTCIVAVAILASVTFPFKAPEETCRVFSLDRFFMAGGMPIAVPLLLLAMAFGTQLVLYRNLPSYVAFFSGFLIVTLLNVKWFRASCRQGQTRLGYLITLISMVAAYAAADQSGLQLTLQAATGAGMAMIFARFHIYLLEAAGHCQRGSAQSTFMLTFDFGATAGMAMALSVAAENRPTCDMLGDALLVASVCVYSLYTNKWVRRRLAQRTNEKTNKLI